MELKKKNGVTTVTERNLTPRRVTDRNRWEQHSYRRTRALHTTVTGKISTLTHSRLFTLINIIPQPELRTQQQELVLNTQAKPS